MLDPRTDTWTPVPARADAFVVNLGDQRSDLEGGYAERTFKLPNPVYFLP